MTERTAADVLSELSAAKLDDLAERVAAKLDERREAEDANPNAYLFAAHDAKEARDRSIVEPLGNSDDSEIPDFRTSEGGFAGGLNFLALQQGADDDE